MSKFFNYNTLDVKLERETRACTVLIQNSDKFFNTTSFLNDLERFFDWLTNKVEINCVHIQYEAPEVELFTKSDLALLDASMLSKQLQQLARLSWAQLLLPQTMIWTFNKQACSFAIELAMGADMRFASPSFCAEFNQLEKGITSMAGMNTLANKKANSAKLIQYNLSSQTVSASELVLSGVIGQINYSESEVYEVIKRIAKQSPTSRIQFKRSFNNELIKEMEDSLLEEISFSNSSLAVGDFKNYSDSRAFTPAREFGKVIRKAPTMSEVNENEELIA